MSYGTIIGQLPGVLAKISKFTQACREGKQTKDMWLSLAKTLRDLFAPHDRFVPEEDEVLTVAAKAYDRFFKE